MRCARQSCSTTEHTRMYFKYAGKQSEPRTPAKSRPRVSMSTPDPRESMTLKSVKWRARNAHVHHALGRAGASCAPSRLSAPAAAARSGSLWPVSSTFTRGSSRSLSSSSTYGPASASDALATVFASCPREIGSPMWSAKNVRILE
jgi:hypothetical protein